MELKILGQVRLRMHEQVDLGATKARGLLGYLAYRVNEAVHVDRIAETLWGDDDQPPDLMKGVLPLISRLRRVFRESGFPAQLPREARSYRLVMDDPSLIDYHRFLSLVRTGHRTRGRGDLRKAVEVLASALRLWTGPPLADLNTSWADRLRETLTQQKLIPAYCSLFDAQLALDDHDFVLSGLAPLLQEHVNEEQLAILWIRALVAAERRPEAVAFYRDFTQRLSDDLGARPSAALVETFQATAQTRRPPAAAATPPNLPSATPYFTGRGDLLDQLDALLAGDHRDVDVVALDGPPGVGKTTLARHWARRQQKQFTDGVLISDLAGYADVPLVEPHTVIATFLKELGVHPVNIPSGTNERAVLLRTSLASRNVLVILDNARDSTHVRPLLAAISGCRTLITSRRQLTGVVYHDGVQRLTVPALAGDDAAALLEKRLGDRAAAATDAITELVDLCQGLPLALRIAGEHIAARPAVPIDELADELRRARRLLDAGSHGDAHTTTLRSAFSWSYHNLRADEQLVFGLIGLHPTARFDVRVIGALLGTVAMAEVERVLDSLMGAHLVTQEGSGRYVVHDLLHDYAVTIARDDQPAGIRDPATRRMIDWYLSSARHARALLVGDDQDVPDVPDVPGADRVDPVTFDGPATALRWLITEWANLVACTYRAAELGYHEHVWRFSACLNALNRYESPRGLLAIHELGHRSATLAGHTAAAGGCLNNLGMAHLLLNENTRAGRCFELALAAFADAGDKRGLAVATHNFGVTRLNLGQPAEAVQWLTEALTMNRRINSEWAVANSHRRLGDAYRLLDRVAEARSQYRQSAHWSQLARDAAGQGASLRRIAELCVAQGEFAEAIHHGEAALDVYDRVRVDRLGSAATLTVLTEAHLALESYADALAMADEAARTHGETHNVSGRIDSLILMGRAAAATGDIRTAVRVWRSANELITLPADPRAETLRDLLRTHEQSVPQPRTTLSPETGADLYTTN